MSLRVKVLFFFGAALALAATGAALLYTLSAIKPERPDIVNGPLHIEPYDSTITIPIQIPISRIQAEVNSVLPRNFDGQEGFNIGGNVHEERLTYTASRSDISVSSNDGVLRFEMSINGRARASAEHCPLGRRLGCDTVRETANLAATVGADISNISLDHNLNLSANLQPRINVTQAEIRIFGDLIPISLRSKTESAIRASFPRLQSNFEQLLTNLNIKEQIQEAWAQADHIVPLHQNPPTWLTLVPNTLSVGRVEIGGESISTSVGLGLQAITSIGEKPEVPKAPAPETLNTVSSQGFNIKLPILVSLEEMQAQLESCCMPYSLAISENNSVIFSDINLFENQGTIILRLRFSSGLFGAHGHIFLEGRPILSENKSTVQFSELDFDIRTEEALLEGASELAKPFVLEEIERQLEVDVESLFEDAKQRAENDLSAISLGSGITANLVVDRIALEDLLSGESKLVAILAAEGSLTVMANEIE